MAVLAHRSAFESGTREGSHSPPRVPSPGGGLPRAGPTSEAQWGEVGKGVPGTRTSIGRETERAAGPGQLWDGGSSSWASNLRALGATEGSEQRRKVIRLRPYSYGRRVENRGVRLPQGPGE